MSSGYIHSYSETEQKRLAAQAEFLEPYIFPTIDLSGCEQVLEVGCGVGAELQIIRRRFPQLRLTGIDSSEAQLAAARHLLRDDIAAGRVTLHAGSAYELPFAENSFDGVCLIWLLEHLSDPARALREVLRVLRPGGLISCTEVFNAGLSLHPECLAMQQYWRAFNALQRQLGGQPDVGGDLARLGIAAGFDAVEIQRLPVRLDPGMKDPSRRLGFLDYWRTLWLSGADQLQARGLASAELVAAMEREFLVLADNPAAIYDYSARQLHAIKPLRA